MTPLRAAQTVTALAVVAVPAVGWFAADWSGGTTLAVYWFETVAMCLFIAARIALHQRWTPRRGHFKYHAPSSDRKRRPTSSFVKGFLVTTLLFSAAHGVFLTAILFLLTQNGKAGLAEIDWRSVGIGCLSVLGFLALNFVMDLASLRLWSFWQLERTAQSGFSRVVVVHLTLIFGLFGVAVTDAPNALFGVFVALKTMAALSTALPQWEPASPPAWLSRVMNRVPSVHPGKRFEEMWAEDRTDEIERRERNEQPWVPSHRR